MLVRVPWPLLGGLVERRYAGPQARRTLEASLRAIKRHCEASASQG